MGPGAVPETTGLELTHPRRGRLERILAGWTRLVLRHPYRVIAASGALALGALVYAAGNLGINTDTAEMLSPELSFRRNNELLKELFPGSRAGITVVIDATTADLADRAANTLVTRLRARPEHIRSAERPGGEAFFRDHALLYLSLDELESLSRTLRDAEPFIDAILDDPTFRGLVSAMADALLEERGERAREGSPERAGEPSGDEGPRSDGNEDSIPGGATLTAAVRELAIAVESFLEGDRYEIPWSEVILGEDAEGGRKRVHVSIVPELDHGRILPAGGTMATIRELAAEVESDGIQWVRVRTTGQTALEHEELEGVSRSAVVTSLFAIVMVCVTLLVGLGSVWMMLASTLTLVVGLILSAAFAAAAVGDLSLISLAFAVLYIGLGIDYAIHLVLRQRELALGGLDKPEAIAGSVVDIGSALVLCAATTSLGFFAFLPTAYAGVAELGLISGTSMFIGLIVALTLLPALMEALPVRPPRASEHQAVWKALAEPFVALPYRHRGLVQLSSAVLAVAALLLLTQVRFDSNPNNLRDPSSESVSTFEDLMSTNGSSPWTLTVLESAGAGPGGTAARLAELSTVAGTRTLEDLVPSDQQAKLATLSDLRDLFQVRPEPVARISLEDVPAQIQALRDLRDLAGVAASRAGPALQSTLLALNRRLRDLLDSLRDRPPEAQAATIDELTRLMIGPLTRTLDRLFQGMGVQALDLEGLPREVTRHWVADDGTRRIQVFPEEDLTDPRAMERFVDEVFTVTEDATDLPVIYVEAGRAVVRAFQQAFLWALLAITAVLLLVLKSIRSTLLVLLPLLLAAVVTGAMTVLLDMPFNFANIIVLPLLFGLGVDNGIHIFHRIRSLGGQGERVLETSTARGVLLSGTTTVLSFSSLAFVPHPGIASLGVLLAMGVILLQVFTLLVLPAFLEEGASAGDPETRPPPGERRTVATAGDPL